MEKLKVHNKLLFLISLSFFLLAIYFLCVVFENRKQELIHLKIDLFSSRFFVYCIFLLALQFLNWFFEALKFQLLLFENERISLIIALKAVYVGNFTAFFTPDRVGTFIGRIVVLKKFSKLKITALTAVGNLSQLMATVFFGLLAFLLIKNVNQEIFNVDLYVLSFLQFAFVLLFVALTLIFAYPFLVLKLFERWPFFGRYIKRLSYLSEISNELKIKIFVLSVSRFLVFYFQYLLLVFYFNVDFSYLDVLVFVGILYGIVTFIPSPFLGNFGTREALALYLTAATPLGLIGPLISFFVWLINVGVSSLIGGLILIINKFKSI
ncbi:MAG: hypothetical protein CL853_05380 [Crocinitomicaceae bacterium]|nr:hypothetical protein [Crocinitomicaceae bacterium]